uniref:Uncharacterized protein n=1 Tax=Anguilla anguilla TaxID=7936 RepID=A0A0E9RBY1_ANGAN
MEEVAVDIALGHFSQSTSWHGGVL